VGREGLKGVRGGEGKGGGDKNGKSQKRGGGPPPSRSSVGGTRHVLPLLDEITEVSHRNNQPKLREVFYFKTLFRGGEKERWSVEVKTD